MSADLIAALRLAREYVENASQRMYDGTNGEGIRREAARRLQVIDAALAAAPEQQTCTMLPDGSAFAVASYPLPKDHWLYAPRGEWDNARDEYAECPLPILTHAQRAAVNAAARYAIRGATMCGQVEDFDPDALVQNLVYALCGPFGAAAPVPAPIAAPLTDEQIDAIRKSPGHAGTNPFARAIERAHGIGAQEQPR